MENHKRRIAGTALTAFVSAAAVGAAGMGVARAVCTCTFADIMPSTKSLSIGQGGFVLANPTYTGSYPMMHGDLPSDGLYGFRSATAPTVTFKWDGSGLTSYWANALEVNVDSVKADIQRFSYTGTSWTNGSDCLEDAGATSCSVPVTGLYSASYNDKDQYFARIWMYENGYPWDHAIDAQFIRGVGVAMPACWD